VLRKDPSQRANGFLTIKAQLKGEYWGDYYWGFQSGKDVSLKQGGKDEGTMVAR